jgi:hypothetical protein
METIINQFETEEKLLRENLLKAGYVNDTIDKHITLLKTTDPDEKALRNIIIREITIALKGSSCGLKTWYIHNTIAKITNLSPQTVQLISNTRNPEDVIYRRRKNYIKS